jgi:hypothetical protein
MEERVALDALFCAGELDFRVVTLGETFLLLGCG